MSRPARYMLAVTIAITMLASTISWFYSNNEFSIALVAAISAVIVLLIFKPRGLLNIKRTMKPLQWIGYLSLFGSMSWIWLMTGPFHLQASLVFGIAAALMVFGFYCLMHDAIAKYRSEK